MTTTGSGKTEALFDFANRHLVAGVSASARINAALGHPLYITRGDGCRLYDVDGREFVDYNLSHGATFLGHNNPEVKAAVEQALAMGIICAYETEYHGKLGEMLSRAVPCAEQVRFANSGSEATFTAMRIARVATGRQKILKFEGHFHGLHDYAIWNAHGPARDSLPTYPYVPPAVESAGVPPQLADLVIVIPWNDPAALQQALAEHGSEIAGIICEPVNFNSGGILPKPGFLELLREEATKHGCVLIFDEVLSSFRMAMGGAQAYYGVTPDICTLAKAVANGLPLAVVAGKKKFMAQLSPLGPAAHSGTYSGHLISVLAAIASLEIIGREGFYEQIFAKAERLYGGLNALLASHGVPARVQGLGARFGIYFGITDEVWDYQHAARIDGVLGHKFIRACFDRGVYFHNYGKMALGHHGFSAAHTLADIDDTLDKVESALHEIGQA
ncbi:MAG: aspartate aminotransferase family protein [Dehalococcoidales bacterium]|nr:aspartate aminotransferase family protein [Dehalococcoidales bacterium]